MRRTDGRPLQKKASQHLQVSCLNHPVTEMNKEVPPSRVSHAHLLPEDNDGGEFLVDARTYLCVRGVLRVERVVQQNVDLLFLKLLFLKLFYRNLCDAEVDQLHMFFSFVSTRHFQSPLFGKQGFCRRVVGIFLVFPCT